MKALVSMLLCALWLLPASARAQSEGSAAPVRDKGAVVFNEVERGPYFAVYGGPLFLVNAPSPDGDGPFSSGLSAQVELGFDMGERFSLGIFALASANRANSDYLGFSNGSATGDFSTFAPGVAARVRLVGFADSQEVVRTWFYLRGGVGYALFSPKLLLPDSDILVFAGPGVEYYTRLRHFSVGLEVTGAFLASSGTFGFAISPNLRYAF